MKKIILFLIAIFTINIVISQNNAPGMDIIGKGYNIFGEYASNNSMKNYRIFDFSKCSSELTPEGYKLPKCVFLQNISDHRIKDVSGSSKRDYAESLSKNLNLKVNAFVFAVSVNTQFREETSQNEQKYCHTIMDANTKWKIELDSRNLTSIIDDQFKTDLETLKPEELFNRYGTHFIKSAFLGGRIDFSLISVITENISAKDIDIAVNARYLQIQGNGSLNEKQKEIIANNNTKIETKTIGGNSEFLNNINNETQYKMWAEGIKNQPVLCDFENESLVPIWELTNNENRKKELERYFNEKIIPLHPLPIKQVIKDNQDFEVFIDKIEVIYDCENALTRGGEFYYEFTINGLPFAKYDNNTYPYHSSKQNDNIFISKRQIITIPNKEYSKLIIHGTITERDTPPPDDVLKPDFKVEIYYPFNNSILEGTLQTFEMEKKLSNIPNFCKVRVYYSIKKL